MKQHLLISLLALAATLSACRGDIPFIHSEEEELSPGGLGNKSVKGFFLLNEGNMGSNKASIDFFSYETGKYLRNIYPTRNPEVVKELGDVGNDIAIYGDKLYAVINCSHYVEVMDVHTAKHIGSINILNCRYITFHKGKAYVSSYAGPVQIDPEYRQAGYVAKVDTATLQVVATCTVGYQPDELAVAGGKLYVANSGGYMFPNYENTLSVIDLATFTEVKRIPVAVNLHRVRADRHGQLWVTSRGDYDTVPSRLCCVDTRTDAVTDTLDIPCSDLWIDGDSLYLYGTDWSSGEANYGIVDVRTRQPVADRLLPDGLRVEMPYGIMVHPVTKDIYLTDAKGHVTPGTLHCFTPDSATWGVSTGDVPAHFALVPRQGE